MTLAARGDAGVPVWLGLFLVLGVGMLLLIPAEVWYMRRKARTAARPQIEDTRPGERLVPPSVYHTNPDLAELITSVSPRHPYAAATPDGSTVDELGSDAAAVEHRRGRWCFEPAAPADPTRGNGRG